MSFIKARDVKVEIKLELDNEPFIVLDNTYFSPGKGQPVSRIKLKSFFDSRIFIKTFKANVNLKIADVLEKKVKFLYFNGNYNFIDENLLEYYELESDKIADSKNWLVVNENYIIILWNMLPLLLKVPKIVTLKVISTEEIQKKTVIAKNMKSAVLETGVVVKLPLFIKVNDKVRIDTEKSEYLSRINL
mgnify:CR=1 FL=1